MALTVPRFDKARVLVVGDVMLDRYWHGGTSRISPEAPVPVVKINSIEDRPGGAGNVALNIAALGAHASLFGLTGRDEAADALSLRLRAAEVDCHFHAVSDHPTITKLRVISRHQQLLRMDFEEPFAPAAAADLIATTQGAIADCGAVILSDYAKGALADPQSLIPRGPRCRRAGIGRPQGLGFRALSQRNLADPQFARIRGRGRPLRKRTNTRRQRPAAH